MQNDHKSTPVVDPEPIAQDKALCPSCHGAGEGSHQDSEDVHTVERCSHCAGTGIRRARSATLKNDPACALERAVAASEQAYEDRIIRATIEGNATGILHLVKLLMQGEIDRTEFCCRLDELRNAEDKYTRLLGKGPVVA